VTIDPLEKLRAAAPLDGEPVLMMPAEAYTSEEVLSWELRHLFAGSWTCLGRVDELLPSTRQRALVVGDVACLLVRDDTAVRMFANTCRHRGHELLAEGSTSDRRSIQCPYHAWTYDFGGRLRGAKGFRDDATFDFAEHGLVELPVRVWEGWVFGHALNRVGSSDVPSFDSHLGELGRILAPYDAENLVLADLHTYEVAANWKTISENYHECYHCPLIHPELCQVSPPESGENYDLPGAWIGGSMVLRDGMQTMSLTGSLAATPLPGVDPTRVEYVHLLPNLLVSAHPDYVMTHRLVPLAPGRTWIECSWLVARAYDGSVPGAHAAVEFWDITNKQDWAACESVARGLASPHFQPGPFAPNEDAVVQLVSMIARAYRTGRLM
jgi:Rieske 2Fe-2S family protein